jgi:hypothetical protein
MVLCRNTKKEDSNRADLTTTKTIKRAEFLKQKINNWLKGTLTFKEVLIKATLVLR